VAEVGLAVPRRAHRAQGGSQSLGERGDTRGLLDWDWATAEELFRKAGELHSDWRVSRADLHMVRGQREEALRQIRRALDEDPLNSWTQTAVGGRLLRLGRHEEGIALLEKAAAAHPNMGLVHRYLWTAHHNQGRLDRALEAARRFLELLGHPDVADAVQRGYEAEGYDRAMKVAADMLAERFETTYVQPSEVARLYAYAGDADRAFAWLDAAYEARDTWMAFVNTDPRFDSLHADPRFRELLRRLDMSE
jgi:tetratricopeptide (TPR) repeat protein